MKIKRSVWVFVMSMGFGATCYAAQAEVPKEVQTFVDRVEGCLHWAGEEGDNNAAREAQIQEGARKLNCGTLKPDAVALRKKYAQNPPAIAALKNVGEEWQAGMAESLFKPDPH